MHDWRAKTKAKLDQVRAQLVTWIDTFTEKFAKSVAALEEKRSTYDLDESNRQQKARLESIRQKQQELIKIQDMYEDAEAGDQEFTLGCMRTQLAKIKTDVHAQELEIIHQAGLDRKQMDELVDVDGLEEKMKQLQEAQDEEIDEEIDEVKIDVKAINKKIDEVEDRISNKIDEVKDLLATIACKEI